MAVFIVAYDLNKVGQNYACITGKLKALPHCHVQGSVWFVDYSGTAVQVRDHLRQCLDENDRLFVESVSAQWAGFNMPACGKWLNEQGL